jgi:flagellar hook-associated protein 1 FlgK
VTASAFSGLTNALAALNAQRYGLDVTGQNIANANTPGYVRQRAELAEVGPLPGMPTLYATQGARTGVIVNGTSRLNDPVLDARVRTEHGRNSQSQTTSATLSDVESLFNEPTDNGLSEQLNDFWNSWATVANNPKDPAARSVVLQKAAGVAGSLNATSAALTSLTDTAIQKLTAVVGDINTATGSLAQLNGAIAVAQATGSASNSLADQRDALVLQLADKAGAQTTLQPDGTVTVTLGGQPLVSGTTANSVAVSGTQLMVGGNVAGPAGGTAQGLLDSLNTVLPGYQAKLDAVAAALANTVNAAHQSGYDLSGNPGAAFFSGATAATISVAITDPLRLAASGTPGGNLDSGNALALSGLGTQAAGADVQYRQLVSTVGSDVQRGSQQAAIQQSVTTSVDAQAQSVSGVSFDEETSAMLTFQRAYQASSRVLTTVDETLDTLISHTGRVGLS